MAVDAHQRLDRRVVLTADQYPIGGLQIANGSALSQELGIGQHRKRLAAMAIALGSSQDRLHRLGGAHRQGALLDHDGVAAGGDGHLAGRSFDPAQIAGLAGTDTAGLGGGVHREKHHIGGGDRRIHLGAEVQIAAPGPAHHRIKAWLIDGQKAQIVVIPGGDALGIEIHHRHLNLGTAISDNRHRGPAHIAGADTTDRTDRGPELAHGTSRFGGELNASSPADLIPIPAGSSLISARRA